MKHSDKNLLLAVHLIPAKLISCTAKRMLLPLGSTLIIVFFLISSPCYAQTGHGDVRNWTNKKGQKISAILIGVNEDQLILKVPNKKIYKVSKSKLSREDLEWARAWELEKEEDKRKSKQNLVSNIFDAADEFKPWPEKTRLEEDVEVKDGSEGDFFTYQTENFKFFSKAKLSKSVVRDFARIFEGTFVAVESLPIYLSPKMPQKCEFYKVILYASRAQFIKETGLSNAGGVYKTSTREIHVPLSSLGVKNIGSRYILDRQQSSGTLVHEITHQLTHKWIMLTPIWFTEGLADYVASAHQRGDRFYFANILSRVKDEIHSYQNTSREFVMRDLKSLMNTTSSKWLGDLSNSIKSRRNYNSAMVLVTYFFHMDGKGGAARIKSYIKHFYQKQAKPETLTQYISQLPKEKNKLKSMGAFVIGHLLSKGKTKGDETDPVKKYLLEGRDYKKLAEDLVKAWKSQGKLQVDFTAQ